MFYYYLAEKINESLQDKIRHLAVATTAIEVVLLQPFDRFESNLTQYIILVVFTVIVMCSACVVGFAHSCWYHA